MVLGKISLREIKSLLCLYMVQQYNDDEEQVL